MLLVSEYVPSKLLPNINPSGNIENNFVEINLRSKSGLFQVLIPNVGHIKDRTVNLNKNLDFYSCKYENVFVLVDWNAEITNNYLEKFCASYNLKNLIKQFPCSKNPDWPHFDKPPEKFPFVKCLWDRFVWLPYIDINGFKNLSREA